MVGVAGQVTAGPGWSELARGDWAAARAEFERALEHGESAAAFEGLSWAAWWVDDEEAVFAARERAYRLYRAADDPRGAARMATWLAVDELDFHGASVVASGWLGRARRLLEPLEVGPDHGWLAFHEGYVARIEGDDARALRLAAEAADTGRRFGVADIEMLGLALEGSTLVAGGNVPRGMRRLDEATALALEGDAAIPIAGAWTFCFLVSTCIAVLDHERAVEWCDRIAEFAERYGSRYMLAFCRAEYGAVDVARGRWDDAEELLVTSVDDFARSRPAWVGGPLVALAELRRRQGRGEDASALLEDAGASEAAQVCRARLALDAGDARAALEHAERSLRQVSGKRRVDTWDALEIVARARIALGELEEAGRAVDELRAIERLVATAPLGAGTDLVEGILAVARGELEEGRTLLEDAVDGFGRSGMPFEAAHARIELAVCLLAAGRSADAQREARAAHAQLVELGATAEAARASRMLESAGGSGPGSSLLSRRELDVLRLVARGRTNRQIAERLTVSEHTVHRHVSNILRKLDSSSRAAAVARAAREGLLDDVV
jgi:LuxR family transcriptional regulator, maltose regulon positive regulatory protein